MPPKPVFTNPSDRRVWVLVLSGYSVGGDACSIFPASLRSPKRGGGRGAAEGLKKIGKAEKFPWTWPGYRFSAPKFRKQLSARIGVGDP